MSFDEFPLATPPANQSTPSAGGNRRDKLGSRSPVPPRSVGGSKGRGRRSGGGVGDENARVGGGIGGQGWKACTNPFNQFPAENKSLRVRSEEPRGAKPKKKKKQGKKRPLELIALNTAEEERRLNGIW